MFLQLRDGDSAPYRVAKLGELGFTRTNGETQSKLIERVVRDQRVETIRDILKAILSAHYRLRFDPKGLTPEEREALGLRVRDAVAQLGTRRSHQRNVLPQAE